MRTGAREAWASIVRPRFVGLLVPVVASLAEFAVGVPMIAALEATPLLRDRGFVRVEEIGQLMADSSTR